MTIWFATGNAHKRTELEAILRAASPENIGVRIPSAADIPFDPEETGASFRENALIKARALHRLLAERGFREPVLADDSGLCVDALGGRPGIYSSRYRGRDGAGETAAPIDDARRNALLLEELGDAGDRTARFICAMVLLYSQNRFCIVQETMEGEIVRNLSDARGSGGFGYDPVLYIPEKGCTVAELPGTLKNSLSHRGKAGRAIAKLLV
ncbi:MAG: RdgB/HAM1 family non-canonical purine NTP pyrophosphatase [Spirochaetaceae bacterium]|jgi:XTP/dITP diphosphohydrolase|nr:RdgB/HAM1 family non-canonical purine NTP pyrophosphatase [Spirochaetaceae bacterium]